MSKVKNPKQIVAVAAFAAFLATFNETFLNIAFSPIMRQLGVSVNTVQWLATAYMLGAAVMVPISAFAYRSIRTKPLFLTSVGLLLAGSIIGAVAPSFPILLTGRIIQALGTGLLIPIGMNITLEAAPKDKLGSYMGIMGAMTTLGPSLSVIIAGALLNSFNWHILFWVYAGMSLLLFLCGAFLLGNIAKLTHPKLDAVSVALISISLIGILYGISSFSENYRIALPAILCGGLFLTAFVVRQKKLKEPLIDLKPLTSKPFAVGTLINMISLVVIFAMNIILPIFIQNTLGASSLSASLTLFPAILLSCVIAPIAGKIYDRYGAKRLLPTGFLLIAIFAAALAFGKNSGSLFLLALLYIPVICGSALIIGPVQSFALSYLKPEENPHGVTVLSTGFQIAGCLGSSLFIGVYSGVISSRIARQASPLSASNEAFMTAALLAAAFALAGFLLSLILGKFKHETAGVQTSAALRSLMKTDVYSVNSDATLLEALTLITQKNVSGVPIVNSSGAVAGFISDGDILRHLAKSHPLFANAYSLAAINNPEQEFDSRLHELMNMKVSEIGHKHVITVSIDDDISEVCRILGEHNLKKAPVMENGRMVGIINNSNIIQYVLNSSLSGIKSLKA